MPLTTDDVLEAFRVMTLADLSAFIRQFKEEFGVQDQAVQILPPGPALPAEPEPEEQTEFTVTLESVGSAKIQVIKTVREILKLGLAEAKGFAESAPRVVLENAPRAEAVRARELLEKAGAAVTIR